MSDVCGIIATERPRFRAGGSLRLVLLTMIRRMES